MGACTTSTDQYQESIDECLKCAQACYEYIKDSDLENKKNVMHQLMECAAICQASVSIMSVTGEFAQLYCQLNSKISDFCAGDCAMLNNDNSQKCAKICKAASKKCDEISGGK